MFMFDNVAGWVDILPPFSHSPYVVSFLFMGDESTIELIDCLTLDEVEALLDALGAASDDGE